MTSSEKKNKRNGLIGTVLFHVVLVVAFLFLGLTYRIPPPPEEGISIDFGFSEQGLEEVQPEDNSLESNPVIEEVIQETIEIEQEIVTQESVETEVIEIPKENKKEIVIEKEPEEKQEEVIIEKVEKVVNKKHFIQEVKRKKNNQMEIQKQWVIKDPLKVTSIQINTRVVVSVLMEKPINC